MIMMITLEIFKIVPADHPHNQVISIKRTDLIQTIHYKVINEKKKDARNNEHSPTLESKRGLENLSTC